MRLSQFRAEPESTSAGNALVPRFRVRDTSRHPSHMNFGSKGAYDSSAASRFEAPKRARGRCCRNFNRRHWQTPYPTTTLSNDDVSRPGQRLIRLLLAFVDHDGDPPL